MDRLIEERVARNDAVFRAANEKIERIVGRDGWLGGRMPVVCECADPTCRELMHIPAEDYEWIRSKPTWFVNLPGHHTSALGAVRIVAERDGYVVVEKTGRAARIVEELDPRLG